MSSKTNITVTEQGGRPVNQHKHFYLDEKGLQCTGTAWMVFERSVTYLPSFYDDGVTKLPVGWNGEVDTDYYYETDVHGGVCRVWCDKKTFDELNDCQQGSAFCIYISSSQAPVNGMIVSNEPWTDLEEIALDYAVGKYTDMYSKESMAAQTSFIKGYETALKNTPPQDAGQWVRVETKRPPSVEFVLCWSDKGGMSYRCFSKTHDSLTIDQFKAQTGVSQWMLPQPPADK